MRYLLKDPVSFAASVGLRSVAVMLALSACAVDSPNGYLESDNEDNVSIILSDSYIGQEINANIDNETDFLRTASGLQTRRQQEAFFYFTSKCLTSIQSAAIIGNLIQESRLIPTKLEDNGGDGRGIAQWSKGGRWDNPTAAYDLDNMAWFAKLRHVSPWEFDAQLDFIWYELSHFDNYGLDELRNADTIEKAVMRFGNKFEVCEPGECKYSKRIRYAHYIFEHFAPRRSDGRPPSCNARGTQSDAQPGSPSGGNNNTCTHGSYCWCQRDANYQYEACDGYQTIEGTRSFCRVYPKNTKCDDYGSIEGTRGFCRAHPKNTTCDDYGGIPGTKAFCKRFPKSKPC